ncbi:MAG: hypothetical protein ACYDBB_18300 [Armatimonadota bacterium]
MKRILLTTVALLFAIGPLFAQGMGGNGGVGATNMLMTDKGLFVLRSGMLVKYDAAALKQAGEIELFGPAPAAPAENADRAARQKYNAEIARRLAPAIMLVKDNWLLIVIGDGFTRISQDTLKPEATGSLLPEKAPAADAAPGAAPGGGRGMFGAAEQVSGYLLVDNTLYLARSKELLAVDIMAGKVASRIDLPKGFQLTMLGGFGNFGGGIRNGGNRGGGGNNAAGNPPAK